MNIKSFLIKKIQLAMIKCGAPDNFNPQVYVSNKPKFGNYQVNGIMSLAKYLNKNSYQLAEQVLINLKLRFLANKIEIVKPGFINIFLNKSWLQREAMKILKSPRIGISKNHNPQTIIVDYSSPNAAKEMHVGHIRSTIIGDSMVRTLEFLGHKVIRANHIGDWGTQFGMLIAYLEKNINYNNQKINSISRIEQCYCYAKYLYDHDENFAKTARKYVVKLQNGDLYCTDIWKKLVNISIKQNQLLYKRLNVTLSNNDIIGESFYNNMLPEVVNDLKSQGLALESQGAIVVFTNHFYDKKGNKMGVIVQKNDGAYLYATTDIACVKYRYETLNANRIIYYVDSRQKQHLSQVWDIARQAKYIPKNLLLEHHYFGMIMDKNGVPFKTREGGTIKLSALLDESVNRAKQLIMNKNPLIDKFLLQKTAEIIGIAAVKYADLMKNRTTNYIFDWDKILSFDGNTALYIQYAYARISSLLRKSQVNINVNNDKIILINDYETCLITQIIQFEETLKQVEIDGTPHLICNYLYTLTYNFSKFYENCTILNIKNNTLKASRLLIVLLTSKILKQGLELLGIQTIENI